MWSHPTRVRGLKRKGRSYRRKQKIVAPHAGAWIETSQSYHFKNLMSSHPTRVRGLKLHYRRNTNRPLKVAPHAGAWIETPTLCKPVGLYLVAPHAGAWIETPTLCKPLGLYLVAPHAGAWIETLFELLFPLWLAVAPHAGAWIETAIRNVGRNILTASHPTRVRGLKLSCLRALCWRDLGRTPRGCVD